MIKNSITIGITNFLRESMTRFLLPGIFTSITTTLNTILRIIKSFTVDLPIAYANIRV